MCFSVLHCLPRGRSLKLHRFRYFPSKGKSTCELHISVSAVQCSCQHSKACRVYARLISQLKFISTLFIYYIIFWRIWLCKFFCVWVWFTLQGITNSAASKSEKGTWLNYKIKHLQTVLWRHIIRPTAYTNCWHVFFCLKPLWRSANYLAFIMQWNLHKLRLYFSTHKLWLNLWLN